MLDICTYRLPRLLCYTIRYMCMQDLEKPNASNQGRLRLMHRHLNK